MTTGRLEVWHIDGTECHHDLDLNSAVDGMIRTYEAADPAQREALIPNLPVCADGQPIARLSLMTGGPDPQPGPAIFGTTWHDYLGQGGDGDGA